MSEIRGNIELLSYDPYKSVPANSSEFATLIHEMLKNEKYRLKHPHSKKSKNQFKKLDENFGHVFEDIHLNHEFVSDYLAEIDTTLSAQEKASLKGLKTDGEKIDLMLLSKTAGNLYSLLGDYYADSDKEELNENAADKYLKSAEHMKFYTSEFKNDLEALKTLVWSILKYFDVEDYENISNDNLLTDLKSRLVNFLINNSDNSVAFNEDLAAIDCTMADYFVTKAVGEDGDMKNMTEPQKRYVVFLFEEAISFAKKAVKNKKPNENSADQTYIDVVLQYSRCLVRLGNNKEANQIVRELMDSYKTPDAKVEIARQFVTYGNKEKYALEMAKGFLNQVAEIEPGNIDVHYLQGKIALAEHMFDIHKTVNEIEKAIKAILELDPDDKHNLAGDLADGLTHIKTALFSARVNRVMSGDSSPAMPN